MNKTRLFLLAPVGAIFGAVAWLRRKFYGERFRPQTSTICIGNLAVGGTGKTPHTEYLIRLLQNENIAVLSRGYGRKTKGFLVSTDSHTTVTAENYGDEPAQMHQKFPNIAVAVCERRKEGIEKLEQTIRPDIILLDDAFQHLQVQCGQNILLTDYARPYWEDLPMPAGNLREFSSAAQHADIIIVSKCPETLTQDEAEQLRRRMRLTAGQRCYFSTLAYERATPMNPAAEMMKLTTETPVCLLTGIANPKPLQNHVASSFKNISNLEFADHHNFSKTEIQSLCNKFAKSKEKMALITTEKDWMRLQKETFQESLQTIPIFVVAIRVKFLFGGETDFQKQIQSYCSAKKQH